MSDNEADIALIDAAVSACMGIIAGAANEADGAAGVVMTVADLVVAKTILLLQDVTGVDAYASLDLHTKHVTELLAVMQPKELRN